MTIIVNVSDARAARDPADTIVTYSLGRCIGVSLHDPVARVGGMLHFQLPTSTLDTARAAANPTMFADTGLNHLLSLMDQAGANRRRLKVRLAGGAQIVDKAGVFDIGRRNHAAIRKALWQQGLMVDAEHVGGSSPRTLYLAVADGAVTLKMNGTTLAL
jgi:chemotaxis protein CheD